MPHPIPEPGADGLHASLRFSDPLAYSRLLRRAHEDVITGTHRTEIAQTIQDSWKRSLALGIDPDQHSPRHVRDSSDVVSLRKQNPLAVAVPALSELLADDSPYGRQLLVITDGMGEVLWRVGSKEALAHSEALEFVEGADWSESGIGTNAISEVLRTGSPRQLFSAEHLVRTHHDWACTAAPIHNPATGELLGVLDVSGPLETLTADSLRMVRCAVRVAEGLIGQAAPTPAAKDCGITSISLLGDQPTVVHASGKRVALTLRRAEILALLCSRQQGWSADELAYELYGETGTAASVRIEVHRLRAALGPLISSNPYRLDPGVRDVVDICQVLAALHQGEVQSALLLYQAPLLSRSSAMAVDLLREELSTALRESIHACASVPALVSWLASDMGAADSVAVSALGRLVGSSDPRFATFSARARRMEQALL